MGLLAYGLTTIPTTMRPSSSGRLGIAGVDVAVQALINIDVPDLERAIRFYEEAFGLRLSRKLFGGSVAEMTGAILSTLPLLNSP